MDVTEKDIHLLASAMQQMADDLAAMAEDILKEFAEENGHDAERLFQRLNALSHMLKALKTDGNKRREHLFWMRDSEQKFRELTV